MKQNTDWKYIAEQLTEANHRLNQFNNKLMAEIETHKEAERNRLSLTEYCRLLKIEKNNKSLLNDLVAARAENKALRAVIERRRIRERDKKRKERKLMLVALKNHSKKKSQTKASSSNRRHPK